MAGNLTFTTIASVPVIVTIGIGLLSGLALNSIDDHFRITEKFVAALEDFSEMVSKTVDQAGHDTGVAIHRGMKAFMRSQGYTGPF